MAYESSTARIQIIMTTPAAVSGALNNTLMLRCQAATRLSQHDQVFASRS
jgi:hypothetical protein